MILEAPAFATFVERHAPNEMKLRPIINDEVREAGAFRRVQRQWRIELQDQVNERPASNAARI